MKITRESDYAVRIVQFLSKQENIVGAKQISEETNITQRFALKILRKLCISDILVSYKGTTGGYKLNKTTSDISLKDVIESTQGPIAINTCVEGDISCGETCTCAVKHAFNIANKALLTELSNQTFDKF